MSQPLQPGACRDVVRRHVGSWIVESSDSKVAGKVGYAPVKNTENSGWLWSWNLGINAESDSKEQAWEFLKWATSKEYAKLVGSTSAGPRLLPEPESPPTRSPSTSRPAGSSPVDRPDHVRGRSQAAGCQTAAVGGHPVRHHSRVPRRRQPDLPADRRLHRGPKTTKLALNQGQEIAQRASENQKKG